MAVAESQGRMLDDEGADQPPAGVGDGHDGQTAAPVADRLADPGGLECPGVGDQADVRHPGVGQRQRAW